MRHFHLLMLLLLAGVAACDSTGDRAEPKTGVKAVYDGQRIRWIIPYSPGGGYDEYARLISPYLEKYTGARVDIVNMPGAGGLRGANELFKSPRNGLTIGMINGSALISNELADIRGAEYKVSDFEFLGRIVADKRVFVVSIDSGYRSFEEVLNAGEAVKIGATGLGGSTYVDAVVVNQAFKSDIDIIHGFDSSSIIRQAMLRGNIAGSWGSWGSALDAVDVGRERVVLQSGKERLEELAEVPTAFELATASGDPGHARAILTAWEALHAVGRPVVAPPGTPADRVRFLSEALKKALHDPELIAVAEGSGRSFHYASAEEMRQIVASATEMPEDVRKVLVSAIKGQF